MDETEMLRQELEHYRTEKERVRKIIGQIGGNASRRRDRFVNLVFLIVIVAFFAVDVLREIGIIHIPGVPSFVLLELAIFLVSLKLVWMIHQQSRTEHFQFWVLNSIEFQINAMSARLRVIEESLSAPGPPRSGGRGRQPSTT